MKLRTLSTIPCLIGVIQDTWKHGTRAVYPVKMAWPTGPDKLVLLRACEEGKHIIHLALNWAEALRSGLVSSCAEIGDRVGLSNGRVRQIVRLARLNPEIGLRLRALDRSDSLVWVSENRLRRLIPLPWEDQLRQFEEWIHRQNASGF